MANIRKSWLTDDGVLSPLRSIVRLSFGALMLAVGLSAQAAPGDNAITGVKITVGSQSQNAVFAAGSNHVTLTFDISGDPAVQSLKAGESVNLPVTTVVDPPLLADSCGCVANELAQQVTYSVPPPPTVPDPTPVPTMSEVGLGALVALMLLVALRTGVGKRGAKVLVMLGLGFALVQPSQELRAAGGNALGAMDVELTGTTVTVTVTRNGECVVNQPPTLPKLDPFAMSSTKTSVILPAASDPNVGETLTYSVKGTPDDWKFDALTRTLSWPATYRCLSYPVPPYNHPSWVFGKRYQYMVTDTCNAPVTGEITCAADQWNQS
ncbi:MAG: hypothetical protein IPG98_05450 [Burkholderiales bacterium]|nr:hypothetical protein [Burkholderiales bacterium]MBK8666364.1 hypothetical protein [Burkholderiales bacterium]